MRTAAAIFVNTPPWVFAAAGPADMAGIHGAAAEVATAGRGC